MVNEAEVPLDVRERAELLIIAYDVSKDNRDRAIERTHSIVNEFAGRGTPLMRASLGLDLISIWQDDVPQEAVQIIIDAAKEQTITVNL